MTEENKKITVGCGGVSFNFIGVIFIILKLTNTVDWSWFWVLCPFWIGIALVITIFLIMGIGALLVFVAALIVEKKGY